MQRRLYKEGGLIMFVIIILLIGSASIKKENLVSIFLRGYKL